jgi:hypothetical protein
VKIQSVTIKVTELKILNWKVGSILVTVLSRFREGKILKALIFILKTLSLLFHKKAFTIKMELRYRTFMLLKAKKGICKIRIKRNKNENIHLIII